MLAVFEEKRVNEQLRIDGECGVQDTKILKTSGINAEVRRESDRIADSRHLTLMLFAPMHSQEGSSTGRTVS
jgi:hypothetical protein